ncbi:MAG: glutamate synthase large subunit [Chloroflexi bacterium]|nr:glutamate synthase large subunit [Chloroflexota bacterium]
MLSRTLYEPTTEHDACGFGFVCDVRGRSSHAIVRDALTVLVNLEHRGASGAERATGDGAGIILAMPRAFLRAAADEAGVVFRGTGDAGFAVGVVFLPRDPASAAACRDHVTAALASEGLDLLGWRDVPTDPDGLGAAARASQPGIVQAFIARPPDVEPGPAGDLAFERRLYVARRLVEKSVQRSALPGRGDFYIPSMSCRTIVYKGMLNASQLRSFYPDLADPRIETAIALVHSRFSTNTFPSWARAHPYRYITHNGEINTLRGNVNWMFARRSALTSSVFGDDLAKILPAVDADGSDTAIFDNVLELLHLSGRSLAHAMMMMVPEPWSRDPAMDPARRAFYAYHACLMEPWDGPASLAFTDGIRVGATLDRNGLRPGRYWITRDERVVMASESGVLDVPPADVVAKGRLRPGHMFLVDTSQGRIVPDRELKAEVAGAQPYGEWVRRSLVHLADLPEPANVIGPDHETVLRRQEVFGYTAEDVRLLIDPMAVTGADPIGSMGNDAALAVLSDRPRLLYDYFTQLFAQVTNPPVDAIREAIIMATDRSLGPEDNLLEPGPGAPHQIALASPILSNADLERIRALDGGPASHGFRAITLPILFRVAENGAGLRRAIEDLRQRASEAIAEGYDQIILSDRGHDEVDAPIPALLAVSAVHHHLVRSGTRGRTGLVLESGEPREAHHFCLLVGYGASAVNPYLAFETIDDQVRLGVIPGPTGKAEARYRAALLKGIVKAISRMGISTVHSYHGAQVFEALGLDRDFVDEYFTWTPTRIGGIGIEVVSREVAMRQARAYPPRRPVVHRQLGTGGEYQWRADGEKHLFDPLTIHTLQRAVRTDDYGTFKDYSSLVDDQSSRLATLRALLELRPALRPVPLDAVEPVEAIVRRFKTGAMSYGSISAEAHEALAVAMNRLGGKSNTGEGGEDPARYAPDASGDSRNSAIKQVASGRFGVTSEYLVSAREIQIKMAQGAKPGEGGQLPGSKVYPWIAKVRGSTPGVGLISPPPHHDIYSIEDLAELIHDLKNANPRARISVKLVSEVGVGTVAAGVAKAHADVVLISGHDGGTGASPLTSIKHAGIPWELGLAETHQVLLANDLRSRITVEVDGQLKTGRDVVVGALLGAEEFGFATAPLVALGCVMMRACHQNTCPVGVATQDPELRRRFTGDPEHVVAFMRFVAQEVREHMARMGFRTIDEMVGRSDRLEARPAFDHWKARHVDLSRVLAQPDVPASYGRSHTIPQEHGVEASLDATTLLALCAPALAEGLPVRARLPIRNVNRVVGTLLGSEVTRRWGAEGLPDDTIRLTFTGSAGQSFGAFLPPGVTLEIEGDANDYVGKGLSGGRIVVRPPDEAPFVAQENVIAGNVALYGATGGEAFLRGIAGERFAVRNSGSVAVVEGVGDHGCEYMTGGRVLVLGPTGRNFAAGMSGGIAWVYDDDRAFAGRCNTEMVGLEPLVEAGPEEIAEVVALLRRHRDLTGSDRAAAILADGDAALGRFVRVIPHDYRRVLDAQARMRAAGLPPAEAEMAAFEENAGDLARAGGA